MKEIDNIVIFNDKYDFGKFIKKKGISLKVGEGSEGVCLLSSIDNKVYKVIFGGFGSFLYDEYNVSEIITTRDFDLKYFCLPEELYVLRNRLIGYRTKYVYPVLFDYGDSIGVFENIYKVNFDNVIRAYYNMVREVEFLSSHGIEIAHDLICNLIFTGDKFVAVDTCGYSRVSDNSFLEEINIDNLDRSIRDIFGFWIEGSEKISNEVILDIESESNMERYVKKLSKHINSIK